jgi:LemA protein
LPGGPLVGGPLFIFAVVYAQGLIFSALHYFDRAPLLFERRSLKFGGKTMGAQMHTHRLRPPYLIAAGLILLISVSGCGYNKLQGLDEDVKAAWGEVQNQYQRRADLVPNLVATVKGAAQFEQDTLQKVIEARSQATSIKLDAQALSNPEAFKKFEDAQRQLSGALSRLLVVVEKYPDLKANANYRDLQAQLEGTENRIAVARKRYVESVAEYNKAVRYFPTNLTAQYLLGLKVRESFSAEEKAAKPPEVKF